ncbi:MAG TPA: alpha/beta fold hydrolase [Solirubrobacteraceae bacterium]|jgi:3-oxoadipate enol-lactonase|nr:alpha/beta fold hydrolase [Solirubrobacteraceae bacterium]
MAALLALDDLGSGEPLILLHGIATDRHIWDLVTAELATDRRVVTPDLPGFGGSAPVGDDFELGQVAERIVRGLAGRGIHGPFDLVGHSLGGGIAIALAAAHPRLVRRLVLVAPAGLRPFPATVSNLLAAAADAVLAARRGAVSLTDVWWGRKLLLALTAADGAELPPTLARQMVEASATAKRTAPALATITSSDLRPLLARTRMPVGVIWGEADRTVPIRAIDDVLGARPEAVVARIPDAGHVPMVECPEEFVAALRTLIQDVTNPSEEQPIFR